MTPINGDDAIIKLSRRRRGVDVHVSAWRVANDSIKLSTDYRADYGVIQYNHDTGKLGLFAPSGFIYPATRHPMELAAQVDYEDAVDVREFAGCVLLEWLRTHGIRQN